MLWETIEPKPGMSGYKIKDAAGNILIEKQGLEIIRFGVPDLGVYSIEIYNHSFPLFNGDGSSYFNATLNMGSSDI